MCLDTDGQFYHSKFFNHILQDIMLRKFQQPENIRNTQGIKSLPDLHRCGILHVRSPFTKLLCTICFSISQYYVLPIGPICLLEKVLRKKHGSFVAHIFCTVFDGKYYDFCSAFFFFVCLFFVLYSEYMFKPSVMPFSSYWPFPIQCNCIKIINIVLNFF